MASAAATAKSGPITTSSQPWPGHPVQSETNEGEKVHGLASGEWSSRQGILLLGLTDTKPLPNCSPLPMLMGKASYLQGAPTESECDYRQVAACLRVC